jgi:hypothetical protein
MANAEKIVTHTLVKELLYEGFSGQMANGG